MTNDNVSITFDGSTIDVDPSKSLLDNLLEQGIKATFSCKKGTCLTCLVQTDQTVPANSQAGLKPTIVEQGYFLACQAMPSDGLTITSANQEALFQKALVDSIHFLPGDIVQIFLKPLDDFGYRAGQFINISGPLNEVRSYSIASASQSTDGLLELHVKTHEFGAVSGWLSRDLKIGDEVSISGANGECFYLEQDLNQPLLLIGTGTGLAPLLGVVRDALACGHTGPISLFHGGVDGDGLYLEKQLTDLAAQHDNLEVSFSVLRNKATESYAEAPIQDLALNDREGLKDYRIYICGDPTTVKMAKQSAYLSGANLADIFSDPFETKAVL